MHMKQLFGIFLLLSFTANAQQADIIIKNGKILDGTGNSWFYDNIAVKDGKIIARGTNRVTSHNDPTAHAEVVARREACKTLNTFQLTGCEIYASCEPCPMCLGAIYWARPKRVFFGCTKKDAAEIDFDDQFIYDEIASDFEARKIEFIPLMRNEALRAFEQWETKTDRTDY